MAIFVMELIQVYAILPPVDAYIVAHRLTAMTLIYVLLITVILLNPADV
jgi:hypothetical protein